MDEFLGDRRQSAVEIGTLGTRIGQIARRGLPVHRHERLEGSGFTHRFPEPIALPRRVHAEREGFPVSLR